MLKLRKSMAALLAAALVLAGCGGSKPAEPKKDAPAAAPAPAPKKDPVKIQFWHGMNVEHTHGKVLVELVNEFNKAQSEVIVEQVPQGSYSDVEKKLLAAIAAGDAPAVAQFPDSLMTKLAGSKNLADLNKWAKDAKVGFTAKDREDIPKALLDAATINGQLVALPFNKSTIVLIYDKKLIPTPPKTWAEFREMAKKATVKGADGQVKTYGTAYPATIWYYGQFFWRAGGQWLSADEKQATFNNEAGLAALNLIVDMAKDGSAIQLKPREYQSNYFIEGRAAMVETTSASLPFIVAGIKDSSARPWGVAPTPTGPKGDAVPISGANVGIIAQAKPEHQEAAWKFIKWLTDTKQTLKWGTSKTGYVPVRKSALETAEWKEFVKANPIYEVFSTQLARSVFYPTNAKFNSGTRDITSAIEAAILGKETPKAALDKAAAAVNAHLNK